MTTIIGYTEHKLITPRIKIIFGNPSLKNIPVAPMETAGLEQMVPLLISHNIYDHFGETPVTIEGTLCKFWEFSDLRRG